MVARSGNWNEYQSSLQKALSLGFEEEVDLIQEQWRIATVNVSKWLQQVEISWAIESQSVYIKIKEANRLGLTTLANIVQTTIVDKEKNVLIGLVMLLLFTYENLQ